MAELQDKVTAAETEIAELKNTVEDLEYNYEVSSTRAEKYDRHLSEALQKLQMYEDKNVIQLEGGKSVTGVSKNKVRDLLYSKNILGFIFQNLLSLNATLLLG